MKTNGVQIIDQGRGPQIAGHRLTVMDVFYYLHRGRDFEFIHRAMPSLTREEFDAVVEYVTLHRDDLIEEDRLVEERIRREIAEQEAKGLRHAMNHDIPVQERVAQLKDQLRLRSAAHAEKNGGQPAR